MALALPAIAEVWMTMTTKSPNNIVKTIIVIFLLLLFVFVCKESEKARILIPLFSQNMTEFLFFSFSLSFIFQIILNFADENKERNPLNP
jgi:hypothetical protein